MTDSIDKIIRVYLASVARTSFSYKGETFGDKTLIVSPLLFRGYNCPQNCGGCCPKFSLDYIPGEDIPYPLKKRSIEINGRGIEILSDLQRSKKYKKCINLNLKNGRCGIYENKPFSCDFELIRFIHFKDKIYLTQKLFGRGWAMKRVDGGIGALCSMNEPTRDAVEEVVRKLNRLKDWADHFKIPTYLDEIITWANDGPKKDRLIIEKTS